MATLDAELKKFFDSSPYRQVIQFDPNGPTDIHKLKLTIELPDALPGIAFDAVSNLRAALDQAGYAAFVPHSHWRASRMGRVLAVVDGVQCNLRWRTRRT